MQIKVTGKTISNVLQPFIKVMMDLESLGVRITMPLVLTKPTFSYRIVTLIACISFCNDVEYRSSILRK